MNLEQTARYARIYELVRAFDRPNGIFALAEAVGAIERGWEEKQNHFVGVAFIEVTMALVNRRIFPDVVQALVTQMLSFDRDRNNLTIASRVVAWADKPSLAAEPNAEAALAPGRAP